MAIAHRATGTWSEDATAADSFTIPLATQVGDTVVVRLVLRDGTQTYSLPAEFTERVALTNGGVRTIIASTSAGGGVSRASIAVTSNTPSGLTGISTVASAYTGVVALGTTATATTPNTISLTTQDANNYVVGAHGWNNANATTASTGTLRGSDAGSFASCGGTDNTAASATSVTCAVTHSGGTGAAVALELRSTSGGGGATAWGAQMNQTWCRIVQA